jgi:hypothetical protein
MVQRRGNARAISDAAWGSFFQALESRATDRGSLIVQADRFFPSSQRCSSCGHKNPAVKDLDVRSWRCPICGTQHQRDHNAAINLIPDDQQVRAAYADRLEAQANRVRAQQQRIVRAAKAGASRAAHLAARKESASISLAASVVAVASMPEETLTRARRSGQTNDLLARPETPIADRDRSAQRTLRSRMELVGESLVT